MSTFSTDVTATSTPVASINQTGEAMFGRAWVYREVYSGVAVQQSQIVSTGSATVLVTVVSHTTDKPKG
jgi:hypothetical protein